MLKLPETLKMWGSPDFEAALKEEVQALGHTALPLQEGLSQSSHVSDANISVIVLNVSDSIGCIRAKIGVFYSGIIAGSCCADDPTPISENTEYCEVLLEINKTSTHTTVTLLTD